MSLGTRFLSACVAHQSHSLLKEAEVTLFVDSEVPAYAWIRAFVSEHRQMPTAATVAAHGHALPAAAEPPQYYLNELRKRATFNHISGHLQGFREAVEERRLADVVDTLRVMLAGANASLTPTMFRTIGELANDVVADYNQSKQYPGLRGVPTGYQTLDHLTLGLQGGDIVVIPGRTGMGKSWILAKMAHAAWTHGHYVGLSSMEMSLVPLARRWVGLETLLNPNLIRSGQLTTQAEQHLINRVNEMNQSPQGGRSVFMAGDFSKRVGQVERMFDENELDALYIDAAYLLTPEGRRTGTISRWERIADVIQELKVIALKVNRPIIITVQMNRNVKKSTTRTLDTTDIGGSDSIPQDASIIVGVRSGPAPFEASRKILDLIKNRDGEEGSIQIYYEFNPVRLDEADPIQQTVNVTDGWL